MEKTKKKIEDENDIIRRLLDDTSEGDRLLKVKRQLKNKFFREYILDKYEHKCQECGSDGKKPHKNKHGKEKPNPLHIHHVDYDWECPYHLPRKHPLRVHYGTGVVSDCKKCANTDKKRFYTCVDKCIVLCSFCHYKAHLKQKKEIGTWIKKKNN